VGGRKAVFLGVGALMLLTRWHSCISGGVVAVIAKTMGANYPMMASRTADFHPLFLTVSRALDTALWAPVWALCVLVALVLEAVGFPNLAGPVRRSGGGVDQLTAMVFAFFFFLIIFVNVLIPELIRLAGTTITGLDPGTQSMVKVVGLVMVAVLIYGLYKHGAR